MKTFIAAFVALFGFCALEAEDVTPVAAAPAAAPVAAPANNDSWDFVGVGFFPDVPPSAVSTKIKGLKLGIPVSFGKADVTGAELSIFASTTENVKGFQGALLYCDANKVTGLQANPIVNVANEVSGLQAGLVNVSNGKTFQFGLINYIKGNSVPCLPLVNFKF